MRPIFKPIDPPNFGAQSKKQEILKPSFPKLERVERGIRIDDKTVIYTTDIMTPYEVLQEQFAAKYKAEFEFQMAKIKGKY